MVAYLLFRGAASDAQITAAAGKPTARDYAKKLGMERVFEDEEYRRVKLDELQVRVCVCIGERGRGRGQSNAL